MYLLKFGIFKNEELKEVENYFSNLNNLRDFLNLTEKDCKSNKGGTTANVRTRFGIVTIHLSKQEIKFKEKIEKTIITIYSKEINFVAVFTIVWNVVVASTDFQYEIHLAPYLSSSSPRFLQELKKCFVIEPIVDDLKDKVEYKFIELTLKARMKQK
jgi:hypothetical protein